MSCSHRIPLVAAMVALLAVAFAIPLTAQDPDPAPAPGASPDAAALEQAGRIYARNCANCHHMPDPAVRADQLWLGQIAETS